MGREEWVELEECGGEWVDRGVRWLVYGWGVQVGLVNGWVDGVNWW